MKHIMRHRWLSAFTLVSLAVFSLLPMLVHAQPAPPSLPPSVGAPPPLPPAQIPAPPLAPGIRPYQSTSPVAQGTVRQYLMNPHGEVDGLLLSDGTQVHLPPHMAYELVATIKPGDPVSVQGYRIYEAPVVKAFVITDTRSGQSVVEHKPPRKGRPLPRPMSEMRAEGTIQSLLYSPRGEVNGAMLEDGTQVHVPPDMGYQLSGLLKVGQAISAEGSGTTNEFGRSLEAAAIGALGGAMTPIYEPPGPRRGR